jgi:formimidoylglutamate deiminase
MSRQFYFAESAYVGSGWAKNVKIEILDGFIKSVVHNSEPSGADVLTGPIVPSVANLHSHAFQRIMAGMTEESLDPNDSFWSWRELMYRLVQSITPDDMRKIATFLYIELLKFGYTQVAEFQYLHHDVNGVRYHNIAEMSSQLVQAAEQVGIGITLLPVLYSYSGFGAQPGNSGQARFINDVDSYLTLRGHCDDLTSRSVLNNTGVCFHSLRAVSAIQITQVLESTDSQSPIHIHISEQMKEVSDCLEWSGQRPVEWLAGHFDLDSRWCLIHATHINDTEVRTIAECSAVVGICPSTEANLGDGIFPGVDFSGAGGVWGVGSDSHVCVSLTDELRSLEYSQRLSLQQRNRMHDSDTPKVGDFLLQQAVKGGAQACNVQMGIDVGSRADFIVLDGDCPFIGASKPEDIINRWIFAQTDNVVKDVFVAGKRVIKDFHHSLEEQSRCEFIEVIKRLM